MRVLHLIPLFLAVTFLAPAAAAETIEWTITGHNENGEYWFEVDGVEGRNPALSATAGDDVKVTFTNVGDQVHNVAFASPISKKTDIIGTEENRTLEFKIPTGASGAIEYVCEPHQALGMKGTLTVQGKEGEGAAEQKESPAASNILVALGVAGLALVLRRRG